jgi:DNA-binding HxlR family transcriptional regulator
MPKPPAPDASTRRSCCPVACTLDLIGDRWTLLVVRDLFAGRTRFAEFARAPEGIASNILTQRLEALVANGLVERHAEAGGGHARYHLTARGRSLRPVLEALSAWGLENIKGTEARVQVPQEDV